jgi:glycosyltransferase involved in cell wall biosynthesis
MKKQTQIKDKNTNLTVGYVSPGWPLSHFPNGIVAYVQNVIAGLDKKTKPIVFARLLEDSTDTTDVINLSNFNHHKSPLQKLVDKILHKINLPYARALRYKNTAVYLAKNQKRAIESAVSPVDIIEMEESFGFAGFLMKMTKIPVVTRIHGPWFTMRTIMKVDTDWDYKLRVFYEGQAIINSHGVTAPSLDVLEKVRQYYGVALPNAQVIPNPVPAVDEQKQWKLNLKKTPTILFVGRFDLHKGGDVMLDAFRLIAIKNQQVELLFVGPDRGVDIKGKVLSFNTYLEQFIPEENIKSRIQFLGHCDSQAITELRMNSLITVFASRYENFPVSLLEALAAGCPAVATAVGGIKEIIVNDYNGLLAESESPQDIADKVLQLMDNPAKMQLLSKNAIEDCNKRFSPKVVAAQTVSYYQSVLDRV